MSKKALGVFASVVAAAGLLLFFISQSEGINHLPASPPPGTAHAEPKDDSGSAALTTPGSRSEDRRAANELNGEVDAKVGAAGVLASSSVVEEPAQGAAGQPYPPYPIDEREFRDQVWPNRKYWIENALANFRDNPDDIGAVSEILQRSIVVLLDSWGRHDDLESRFAGMSKKERKLLTIIRCERTYYFEPKEFSAWEQWQALLDEADSAGNFNSASWAENNRTPRMNPELESQILLLADDALNTINQYTKGR